MSKQTQGTKPQSSGNGPSRADTNIPLDQTGHPRAAEHPDSGKLMGALERCKSGYHYDAVLYRLAFDGTPNAQTRKVLVQGVYVHRAAEALSEAIALEMAAHRA